MKILIILSLLSLFTSCGSNHSSGNGATIQPVVDSAELSTEEETLRAILVKKEIISQKELIQELIKHKEMGLGTLKKLDQFINLQCIQSSGLCYITQKD